MDIIQPSEGCVAGSIPAGRTTSEIEQYVAADGRQVFRLLVDSIP
jgi:hypothetical protein